MNSEYEKLINSLIADGHLKTKSIIEAFKNIDRADFIPDEYKKDTYVNAPLPIGFDQTISQPLTVAFMIELLEPKVGEKILDIGSGSGWQTTILASIVSENDTQKTGKIIAIERIPELKEMTERNVAKYNFIKNEIVQVIEADGSNGYKKEAPFDKIIAAAAAKGDVPLAWRQQLKIGGRIVAPIGNSIITIEKTEKDSYEQKEFFGFNFVPLITK